MHDCSTPMRFVLFSFPVPRCGSRTAATGGWAALASRPATCRSAAGCCCSTAPRPASTCRPSTSSPSTRWGTERRRAVGGGGNYGTRKLGSRCGGWAGLATARHPSQDFRDLFPLRPVTRAPNPATFPHAVTPFLKPHLALTPISATQPHTPLIPAPVPGYDFTS